VSPWRRGLLATTLTALAVGVPIAAVSPPVRAGSTICVGIVVDYGAAKPGGGANSYCATLPVGSTGADVLAARARALGLPLPTYRSDGLLCTIDGYPDDGSCGAAAPGGGYRYWSYWHKFPASSTWTYSAAGPAGFTVSNGELEGWAFQNGGPEAGQQPPPVDYSSVCRTTASPTPSRSVAPPPPPSRAAPAPAPTVSPTAGAGPGRAGVASSSTAVAPARAAGPSGHPSRRPASSTTPAYAVASGSPPPSAAPSVVALTPVGSRLSRSSGFPLLPVAGLALAGVLVAAGARRARSRPR